MRIWRRASSHGYGRGLQVDAVICHRSSCTESQYEKPSGQSRHFLLGLEQGGKGKQKKASNELWLEVLPDENNEGGAVAVTGVGEDFLVLGISAGWYWFCGGRVEYGGIMRCLWLDDGDGCRGTGPWPIWSL